MADIVASTDGGLKRLFNKPNFNAEKFISRVSADGGSEIIRTIKNLNNMSEDASNQMKSAIYQNFRLFIEAGKAVSSLGATMHQLDNLLLEQKRICSALSEKSLFAEGSNFDSTEKSQTGTSNVTSMLNSVEGVTNLLQNASRQLLYEADANELNSTTYSRVAYIHLFVLTDFVLFAKRSADLNESYRYQKQSLYEIENITAVTLTGESQKSQQNLVQVLVFPDVRIIQFESLKDKRGFLSALEEAKRLYVSTLAGDVDALSVSSSLSNCVSCLPTPRPLCDLGNMEMHALWSGRGPVVCSSEIENVCLDAIAGTIPEAATFIYEKKPLTDKLSGRHQNPFQDDNLLHGPTIPTEDAWLLDVPEDVDVAVAIRDFASATKLISRSRRRIVELIRDLQSKSATKVKTLANGDLMNYASSLFSLPSLKKLSDRIEHRVVNLSLVLQDELTKAADRNGAALSVRAAVLYLADLGKTVIAVHLFLAYRSSLLNKKLTRGVRQEGNQLVYLNRLSLTFHQQLVETVTEWNQLVVLLSDREEFQALKDFIASKLCSWILEETVKFCNQLKVILVESRSISFYTMACATERIHIHSSRIADNIGVDIKSTLNSCMLKSWRHAVEEQLRVYKDAIEHRVSKENWQGFPDDKLEAQVKAMLDIGFSESKQFFSGGKRLTSYTLHTSRSLAYFVQACLRFDIPELSDCFTSCLSTMLQSELEVYRSLLKSDQVSKNFQTIFCNFEFFTIVVVPKIITSLNLKDHPDIKSVLRPYKKLLKETQTLLS